MLGTKSMTGLIARAYRNTTALGARLGAGYAQIINLSAAPDLHAANYTY